jgi:hypothetical protein
MNMKKYLIFLIGTWIPFMAKAQVKEFTPGYFVGKDSTLYWNKKYRKLKSSLK